MEIYKSAAGALGPVLTLNNPGGGGSSSAIDFQNYSGNTQPIVSRMSIVDDGLYSANLAFSTKTTGASGNALAERMRITSTGNVGIGLTAPTSLLHVSDASAETTATTGAIFNIANTSSTGSINKVGLSVQSTGLWNGSSAVNTGLVVNATGGTTNYAATFSGGNVGIGITAPSYTLHVVGTAGLSSGTSWTNASDIRLKDVEGDYEYGLAEVKKLHAIRFRYKKDNPLKLPYEQEHTGFIAQEVKELIPDAVITRADGYLELNVDPIHWATVNAVKELAEENDRLRAESASLKAQSAQLKAESAQLKARADQADAASAQLKASLCGKFPDLPVCSE